MSNTRNSTPAVTAKIAAAAVKAANDHVKGADAAYRDRVAFVVAAEAARLGAMSGNILADTVSALIVANKWDIGFKAALTAYTEAGGAEGTFRVASTTATLFVTPKKSAPGFHAFNKAVSEAVLADNATDQIAKVKAAVIEYKGKHGWRAFRDMLADKQDAKPKAKTGGSDMLKAAIEAGLAGDDPEQAGKAMEQANRADAAMEADAKGNPVSRVASFFEHCTDEQAHRTVEAMSSIAIAKIEAALKARADKIAEQKAATVAQAA